MEIGGRSMSLVKTYARIEELEQENAQLRLQIDMLKMERENDGWIPCSTGKMPEDNQGILFCTQYKDFFPTVYHGYFLKEGDSKGKYIADRSPSTYVPPQNIVTAWRPLPEPYKDDADATK